jgi:hypothetical protein
MRKINQEHFLVNFIVTATDRVNEFMYKDLV